jgi:hypothetical protein
MSVIVLVTKNIDAREIPSGAAPKLGDQLVFTDDLLDKHGQEVGQHSGFCTRVRIIGSGEGAPDLWQCQATLTLPQGSITARGAFKFPAVVGELSGRAAITGGTDAYAKARGQISVTTLANGDRLDIDIR